MDKECWSTISSICYFDGPYTPFTVRGLCPKSSKGKKKTVFALQQHALNQWSQIPFPNPYAARGLFFLQNAALALI